MARHAGVGSPEMIDATGFRMTNRT